MVRSLAVDYGAFGITCNTLAPGATRTPLTGALQAVRSAASSGEAYAGGMSAWYREGGCVYARGARGGRGDERGCQLVAASQARRVTSWR